MQNTLLPSREQVVAAVYETILRPELADRYCTLEQGLRDRSVAALPGRGTPVVQTSDLKSHFQRALEILEQQWRQAGSPSYLTALENAELGRLSTPKPKEGGQWTVVGPDCRPLRACSKLTAALSAHAGAPAGSEAALFAALQMGLAARGAFRGFIRSAASPQPICRDFLLLETFAPGKLLLCRPVNLTPQTPSPAMMIEVLDAAWPINAAGYLAGAFGLEAQEVALLKAYLTGHGQEAYPTQALASLATKVGAPGPVELIRLVGYLLRENVEDTAIAAGDRLPPFLTLENNSGRQTQCFRLGAETGQPVIFVHGMLDGIAGVQRLQPDLRQRGFRVYAPMRGGYGASRPAPPQNHQMAGFVDQIEQLIDQEKLQRPVLLGHRSGVTFARAAALRLQDRIGGIVGVAPELPLTQTRNYRNLRGHHKGLALSSYYLPSLVPLVLRSWARSVRRRGAATLIRRQAQPGSRALAEINALKLDAVLGLSHELMMQQGGAGFLADLALSKADSGQQNAWSETSTIYLCGEEETSLPQEGLYPALKGREKFQTRICEDAGNVLLYSRPELVLAALEEMSTQAWRVAV